MTRQHGLAFALILIVALAGCASAQPATPNRTPAKAATKTDPIVAKVVQAVRELQELEIVAYNAAMAPLADARGDTAEQYAAKVRQRNTFANAHIENQKRLRTFFQSARLMAYGASTTDAQTTAQRKHTLATLADELSRLAPDLLKMFAVDDELRARILGKTAELVGLIASLNGAVG